MFLTLFVKTRLVHTPIHVQKEGKNDDFSNFLPIKMPQMCRNAVDNVKYTTFEPKKLPKRGWMRLSYHNKLSKHPAYSAAYLGGGIHLSFCIMNHMSNI